MENSAETDRPSNSRGEMKLKGLHLTAQNLNIAVARGLREQDEQEVFASTRERSTILFRFLKRPL
jgi:hypothetical protein